MLKNKFLKTYFLVLIIVYFLSGFAISVQAAQTVMSKEQAIRYIRQEMVARNEQITLSVKASNCTTQEQADDFLWELLEEARAHTGNPKEGDYLKFQSVVAPHSATLKGDTIQITIQMEYYTNAQQERELDAAIAEVVEELTVPGMSDFDKVHAVYQYITGHVSYDYEHLEDETYNLKATAYAALMNKTAICQGYANLCYRLMLEMGVDNRFIGGWAGENHAWNIVELDDLYYNVDVTWDAQMGVYSYFLKTDEEFGKSKHSREPAFSTDEFYAKYPMAQEPYVYGEKTYVCGDFKYTLSDGYATLYRYIGKSRDVVIPAALDGYSVVAIGNKAFYKNLMIKTVTIPSSVQRINDNFFDTSDWPNNINYAAFRGCMSLEKVVFSSNSKLESIGTFAFDECTSLKEIELPSSVRELRESCFEECTSLAELVLPEGVEIVGQNAIYLSGLKKIHIPASCRDFNAVNCTPSIEAYTVADGNPYFRSHEGVLYTNLQGTGWTLTNYPQGKKDSVYRVPDYAVMINSDSFLDIFLNTYFVGETPYLEKLYIGNCEGCGYGDYAFSRIRCEIIADDTNPKYKSVNGLLLSKDGKRLEQAPSKMTGTFQIPDGIEVIGEYTCEWSNFTEVIVPDSVKKISGAAFWNCKKLEKISLPERLTDLGADAFADCSSLKTIKIPSGIKTIRWNTFVFCSSLEIIWIPDTVTKIEAQAFEQCNNLSGVYYEGTMKQWNRIAIEKKVNKFLADVGIVSLKDKTPLQIKQQPTKVTVDKGQIAEVTLKVSGYEPRFEWYFKDEEDSEFSIANNFTGKSYSVEMNDSLVSRQVYCVVTDAYGNSVQSNIITLKLENTVNFFGNPTYVPAKSGEVASITIEATGDGLSYKWYYKNLDDNTIVLMESFTGNSCSIEMDDSRLGHQVYCVVTDEYGNSAITNSVTLNLENSVKLISQPSDVTVEKGVLARVVLDVTGDGLTYKWYFKNVGDSNFSVANNFSGIYYSIMMDERRAGRQIYCVITDEYGNSVTTNTVTLNMSNEEKIDNQSNKNPSIIVLSCVFVVLMVIMFFIFKRFRGRTTGKTIS